MAALRLHPSTTQPACRQPLLVQSKTFLVNVSVLFAVIMSNDDGQFEIVNPVVKMFVQAVQRAALESTTQLLSQRASIGLFMKFAVFVLPSTMSTSLNRLL